MSENIDLILLIVGCVIILIFHARADYLIYNGCDSGEELNKAIVRDIVYCYTLSFLLNIYLLIFKNVKYL